MPVLVPGLADTTIILNGVANQSMTNESDVITIGYLLIDKPSGTAILNDSLTLNAPLASLAFTAKISTTALFKPLPKVSGQTAEVIFPDSAINFLTLF
jgi:hypothetical protein